MLTITSKAMLGLCLGLAAIFSWSCGGDKYDSVGEPPVKLSRTGICHKKGSRFYEQTRTFKSYNSLSACIGEGGRPPKVQ
ncbi:MAG: hypothetical protein ACKN97_05215 [Acidobacteriota bacterium]